MTVMGVIGIDDGEDAGGAGDLLSREAACEPLAVPRALMAVDDVHAAGWRKLTSASMSKPRLGVALMCALLV